MICTFRPRKNLSFIKLGFGCNVSVWLQYKCVWSIKVHLRNTGFPIWSEGNDIIIDLRSLCYFQKSSVMSFQWSPYFFLKKIYVLYMPESPLNKNHFLSFLYSGCAQQLSIMFWFFQPTKWKEIGLQTPASGCSLNYLLKLSPGFLWRSLIGGKLISFRAPQLQLDWS